jgi:hypothetical protein
MLNILVVVLFILTLPIWLILLAMISPWLIPIAFGVVLWVVAREVSSLGKNMTKYETSVSAVKGLINEENDDKVFNPEPKPYGTPDKLTQTKGYTIEMYLREKPAVYRILDKNLVDFGINYKSLAEALHEIDSYSI